MKIDHKENLLNFVKYFFPTKRNRCSSYSGTIKYDTFVFQLWSKEGSLEDSSPPHGLWGYLKVQSDGFTSQRHLDKNGQHGGKWYDGKTVKQCTCNPWNCSKQVRVTLHIHVVNTLCLLIHCLILFPDFGSVDTRIHV